MRKPTRKLERDSEHRYTCNGKVVPGTTEVISDCKLSYFSMVQAERLEFARLRGLYVHATLEFEDQGDLLEDTLSDTLKPYLTAWRRFKKEAKFAPDKNGIELMGYSTTYGFAGQCDRIGKIRGKPAIIDIKPANYQRWWEVQLTAYAMIFFPGKIPYLLDVSLHPDGTYRVWQADVKRFVDNRDVFLAALKIWQYKRKGK